MFGAPLSTSCPPLPARFCLSGPRAPLGLGAPWSTKAPSPAWGLKAPQPPFQPRCHPRGKDRRGEAGCGSWSRQVSGACQEKPPLVVCLQCQQAQGRCQEGQDRMEAMSPWPQAFPGGCKRKQPPWASGPPLGRPHGAGWEPQRLTYWKGRRMARMSPLKKRVMSSTKSTPWQDVKSNCRDRTGVSCQAPLAHTEQLGIPGGPWLGRVLARRPRPLQQATFPCSPPEPSVPPPPTPGGLPDPPHPFTPPHEAWSPHPLCLHLPAGPRADLGLEAKDGDREADEGRDTQTQQHGCGVVVTAGPAGREVSF